MLIVYIFLLKNIIDDIVSMTKKYDFKYLSPTHKDDDDDDDVNIVYDFM